MDTTRTYLSQGRVLRLTVVFGALFQCIPAVSQTAGGSVSGKLITESGQPLLGVTAVYRRAQRLAALGHFHGGPASGEPVFQGALTTRADGTFSATALPAGNYALCLDNPPALYIDPCHWNLGGTTFSVAAGANTALKPITIVSGVRIHFLITDAQNLLPAGADLQPTAYIGVETGNRESRPATVNSRNGNVIDVMITVPHNQAVKTWVTSKTVTFRDSTGAVAQPNTVSPQVGVTDYNILLTVGK